MQCKYCFAEIEDDATVCPLCGKELKGAEETVETVTEETVIEETVTEETAEVAVEEREETVTEETEFEEAWEGEDEEETEEIPAPKKKSMWWKILLAVLGVVVLAVLLTGVILKSLGVLDKVTVKVDNVIHSLKFWREEDLYYKKSYTVKDEKAEKNVDTVVATAGNQTLTSGELQAYYWMTVSRFLETYGDYLGYLGLDITVPFSEQVYDETTGMTYEQMFLDIALRSWHENALLVQRAEDEGFALTDEQKAEINAFEPHMNEMCAENGYTDIEEFMDKEFFPGGSLASYANYNRVYYTATAYYASIEGSLTPTKDEIKAYHEAHHTELEKNGTIPEAGYFYNVRHILIGPTGGAASGTYTEQDWANWEASAQAVLDDFVKTDGTEDGFAALAKELSVDEGSAAEGGLYKDLTTSTQFVEEFKAWCLDESRKPGDTGIVKTMHGYHIMYFSGSEDNWERGIEPTLKNLILSENVTKLIEAEQAKYPMTVNYKDITLGYVNLAGE